MPWRHAHDEAADFATLYGFEFIDDYPVMSGQLEWRPLTQTVAGQVIARQKKDAMGVGLNRVFDP